MKKEKEKHEIVSVALAYARCSCGWQWKRQGQFKGLTDEDLAIETGNKFIEHQNEARRK